jgi:hypothetical protein
LSDDDHVSVLVGVHAQHEEDSVDGATSTYDESVEVVDHFLARQNPVRPKSSD